MAVLPTSIAVVALAVVAARLPAPAQAAAEPPRQAAEEPSPDPQEFFNRLFGDQREADKEALAAIEVSLKEEQRMGRRAVEAYLAYLKRQKIRVVSRGKEVQYLRDLVETVRPLMKNRDRYRRITIYLAQSSRCDARSFPGGTLVFFRGLLETAGSEAAVVGIVGHELSHLDRGHHLWRVRRIKAAQKAFADDREESSLDRLFAAGSMMARVWAHPFRPEDEAEADRDGARWAYAAGYDPRETARMFLKLGQRQLIPGDFIPSFLRSHPAPEGRHKAIMELYRELQEAEPKEKLYIGRENLRRRVARVRRRFDE